MRKKSDTVRDMGTLVQVVGWMSPDEKKRLVAAIKKHSFIDGQSDFINRSAEALISQSENGKPAIAQPLRFMTVDERDLLAAIKLKRKLK